MELSLAGNELTDAVAAVLSECLCGNDKLLTVDLGRNRLTAHSTLSLSQLYATHLSTYPLKPPQWVADGGTRTALTC